MISQMRLLQLINLIKAGREAAFYHWQEGEALRTEVMRLDNWECQRCKAQGRHRAATKAKIPPATTKTAKILPRCFISLPSRFAPVIFLSILYHKKHPVASKFHTLQHLRKTLHKLRIPPFSDVLHKIALT